MGGVGILPAWNSLGLVLFSSGELRTGFSVFSFEVLSNFFHEHLQNFDFGRSSIWLDYAEGMPRSSPFSFTRKKY